MAAFAAWGTQLCLLASGCGRAPSPLPPQKPMVAVPAGGFYFGDESEPRYLPQFWIDKHEVSNGDYLKFVKATGARVPFDWRSLPGPRPPRGQETWPVHWVTREEALAYARWAGKDLPTEMEWEKAARGTDRRLYPWGEWDHSRFSYYGDTALGMGPVGMHPRGASPYGAEDMLGNVMEWTKSDMLAPNAHGKVGRCAVVRGGNVEPDPRYLVLTNGVAVGPTGRYSFVGFRCVRREPPGEGPQEAPRQPPSR